MVTIRSLLDVLKIADRAAIDRLCRVRGVEAGIVAKRERLARSYRGDHERLFGDLREQDLRVLLANLTDGDGGTYHLPDATYSKAKLVRIALACFRDNQAPPELVRLSSFAGSGSAAAEEDEEKQESDDGLQALDDDDSAPDDLEDDSDPSDLEFNEEASRFEPYSFQRELTRELALAVARATRRSRLRITVATGGGKTRIANDWIGAHALTEGRRVLWITKDWALLRQAATDLCRRWKRAYVGHVGEPAQFFGRTPRSDAVVTYTTIHMWRRRKHKDFAGVSFDTVIIDELHWGEGKQAYRGLLKAYPEAVFVGLTATPRQGTGFRLVGCEYDYPTLARMDVLAPRLPEPPVKTRVSWAPVRRSSYSDFTTASLTELANDPRRTRMIVDTYINGRERYGQTLIFACNIQHAMGLFSALKMRGVAVGVVHSALRPEERRAAIDLFKTKRTCVLVNVAMMTHGIDIPGIKTVFLARPTASMTLFAQMVGRAVRKAPGKDGFRIVDFEDALTRHGDVLVSPKHFFDPMGSDSRGGKSATRAPMYTFEPARFEHIALCEGYEGIAGFDLQPKQDFGIEFEFTRSDFTGEKPPDWLRVATALLRSIPQTERAAQPREEYHEQDKNHEVWNVEWDSSCGWEVTSRILRGEAGYREVVRACNALQSAAKRLGLSVSTPKTGTHVHFAWNKDLRALRRLMQLVSYYEPALYSLVAPSRGWNPSCEPIRQHVEQLLSFPTMDDWQKHFLEHLSRRYLTVNPRPLFDERGMGTIEVRLHSGTVDGQKILGWISLWMRLLYRAEERDRLPEYSTSTLDLPLATGPEGDVVHLADFVRANSELSQYLRQRRNDVVRRRWLADSKYAVAARAAAHAWGIEPTGRVQARNELGRWI